MTRTSRSTLVLWDVDHTLIDNGGVSKDNYALAFEILVGRAPEVAPRTDGRTDILIMEDILEHNNVAPIVFSKDTQWAALTRAAQENASRLLDRGKAMEGAAACLRLLDNRTDVIQSLLTGNIKQNARLKLASFSLDHWLDFDIGAFGEDKEIRAELVAVAQARAAKRYEFRPDEDATVIIGDTELDVRAGIDGGARVVAVATGLSTADQLSAAGADAVLDDLQDTVAFGMALDKARSLGALHAKSHTTELGYDSSQANS